MGGGEDERKAGRRIASGYRALRRTKDESFPQLLQPRLLEPMNRSLSLFLSLSLSLSLSLLRFTMNVILCDVRSTLPHVAVAREIWNAGKSRERFAHRYSFSLVYLSFITRIFMQPRVRGYVPTCSRNISYILLSALHPRLHPRRNSPRG